MQKKNFNYLGSYSEKGNCITEKKYVYFKATIQRYNLLETKLI
jgi:hypothetical protein